MRRIGNIEIEEIPKEYKEKYGFYQCVFEDSCFEEAHWFVEADPYCEKHTRELIRRARREKEKKNGKEL